MEEEVLLLLRDYFNEKPHRKLSLLVSQDWKDERELLERWLD